MAGLPRRIIKVTAQTGLQLPALLLPARQRGCSLPPARAGRPQAGGEGLARRRAKSALGRGRGETSGRGGAAPRRTPGASRRPPESREGLACARAEGGVVGFWSWARASAVFQTTPRRRPRARGNRGGARTLGGDGGPTRLLDPGSPFLAGAGAQGRRRRRFRMNEAGG